MDDTHDDKKMDDDNDSEKIKVIIAAPDKEAIIFNYIYSIISIIIVSFIYHYDNPVKEWILCIIILLHLYNLVYYLNKVTSMSRLSDYK